MKKLIFILLVILASSSCFAVDGIILKTLDYSFLDKWNKTSGVGVPEFSDCDIVYKDQDFFLAIIASNYGIDDQNIADITFSINVLKPDKRVHFSQENLLIIKEKVVNKKHLQISHSNLKMSFKEADILGIYTIEITITDNVLKTSKKISTTVELTSLSSYKTFKIDEEGFSQYLNSYYKSPQPSAALANYLYYINSPYSDNDNTFLPIFSTFLEIFKHNKFLSKQVLDCYDEQDDRTKIFLLYLMHYADLGKNSFYEKLEGIEKEAYEGIKVFTLPDIYGEINNPAQLDMLWSVFSTTGSYKPILKLIKTLEYTKYQGYLEKFKSSKQTEEDKQLALKNAIYNSLTWSLKSNCKQYNLVKYYANWALQNEKLTETQQKELKVILDSL